MKLFLVQLLILLAAVYSNSRWHWVPNGFIGGNEFPAGLVGMGIALAVSIAVDRRRGKPDG